MIEQIVHKKRGTYTTFYQVIGATKSKSSFNTKFETTIPSHYSIAFGEIDLAWNCSKNNGTTISIMEDQKTIYKVYGNGS